MELFGGAARKEDVPSTRDSFDEILSGQTPYDWYQRTPGEQVRQAREYRGLSQRALADELGVSAAVICRLEAAADARFSTCRRAFEALGFLAAFSLHETCEEADDLCTRLMLERLDRMGR